MQNLNPQEINILQDFYSRLNQCKENQELMSLSPKTFIDKKISERITNKIDDKEPQKFNEITETGEDSFHFKEPQKANKNRLIVPKLKVLEETFKSEKENFSNENLKEIEKKSIDKKNRTFSSKKTNIKSNDQQPEKDKKKPEHGKEINEKKSNKKIGVARFRKYVKEKNIALTPELKVFIENHILKCENFVCEILHEFK